MSSLLSPHDFYLCESVEDANATRCTVLCSSHSIAAVECELVFQFDGEERFEDVQTISVNCSVLEGVECAGDRSFIKTNVPCVR